MQRNKEGRWEEGREGELLSGCKMKKLNRQNVKRLNQNIKTQKPIQLALPLSLPLYCEVHTPYFHTGFL